MKANLEGFLVTINGSALSSISRPDMIFVGIYLEAAQALFPNDYFEPSTSPTDYLSPSRSDFRCPMAISRMLGQDVRVPIKQCFLNRTLLSPIFDPFSIRNCPRMLR